MGGRLRESSRLSSLGLRLFYSCTNARTVVSRMVTRKNVGGQFCFLEIVFKNLFLAGVKFISER